MSGYLYLKTKSGNFKKFWGVIIGKEIYFFKRKDDVAHKLMHSLVETIVTTQTVITDEA